MPHALTDSKFAEHLRAAGPALDDRACRRLVLRYARRYQDIYPFDVIENTLTALECADGDLADLDDWLAELIADVDDAMVDYCFSLNEVASAARRLLDERPLGPDDVLVCVDYIWRAFACNKPASEFMDREDAALCELLAAHGRVGPTP